MPVEPNCPSCRASFSEPRERVMPDNVVEFRCPNCNYQIPLLAPAHTRRSVPRVRCRPRTSADHVGGGRHRVA